MLNSLLDPAAHPWYLPSPGAPPASPGRLQEALKRALDIVVALAALPVILPVLVACAVAIKRDSPGPVFFLQERTGRHGCRFRMFKLRTMVQNADEMKERWRHLSEVPYPEFKCSVDPRMTRVGRFLRRASLDELPQIFNVLRGDMSVVGPRPTSFDPSTYALWQTGRLDGKPGMTGLWQVSGRNKLNFEQRARLDIAYLRHRSLWLDIRILVRTVACVATARGAS